MGKIITGKIIMGRIIYKHRNGIYMSMGYTQEWKIHGHEINTGIGSIRAWDKHRNEIYMTMR